MSETMITPKKPLPANFVKLGWALTLIGLVLVGISYLFDPQRALQNNLIGFTFLASVAGGSLFYFALEYIAGAVWSTPFRRITEFLVMLLPFVILLSLPLFFHLQDLYEWTHKDVVALDKVLQSKEPYLNVQFFVIRFVVTMLIWLGIFFILRANSLKQDVDKDQKHTRINIKFSIAFLPFFAISICFFGFVWLLWLCGHWFS